jgi:large subunit ribosomal protein L23
MNILVRPIVTEKMTSQAESLNRYGFIVKTNANKLEIKKAIEDMYKVSVSTVNTVRYDGKVKTRFTKAGSIEGRLNSFKKAIVTLKEGDKIDFYSNI